MSQIIKDPSGVYWLQITEDPTVELWYVQTPGGETRTFAPKDGLVRLGKNLAEPVIVKLTPADVMLRPTQEYVYPAAPPPDPDPDPDPQPAGAFGSEVLAKFPWVKPLYDAAVGTPDRRYTGGTSPRITDVGTQSNPVVIDGGGKLYGPRSIQSRSAAWAVVQNFKRVGTGSGDPTGVGDDDGFDWIGCQNFMYRLIEGTGLRQPEKVQGIAGSGGKRVCLLGGRFTEIRSDGTRTRSHPIYLSSGFEEALIASLWAESYDGYGLHFYPGPGRLARATHCTILKSYARSGGIVSKSDITDVEIHNSIIGLHALEAFSSSDGGTAKIFDSVLFGKSSVDAGIYVDSSCLVGVDPQLDALGRPQNPRVLAMGNPKWRVPHDCRGVPITRGVGAVAA